MGHGKKEYLGVGRREGWKEEEALDTVLEPWGFAVLLFFERTIVN